MIQGKKVIVVLPAYRAEKTLEKTINEVPKGIVDEFILVDDCSPDETVAVANKMGLRTFVHEKNLGYGGNQKTCYTKALELGADIVIMLHPDYQYNPKLVPALAYMIASDVYDVVLASRILGKGALTGGMPLYKYVANRFLTFVENVLIDQKLSEYHTGYRAFNKKALTSVNWKNNSNDFVFDNEIIVQMQMAGLRIGEISCPTLYFEEASSINFSRSIRYGLGVLGAALKYRLHKWGLIKSKLFH